MMTPKGFRFKLWLVGLLRIANHSDAGKSPERGHASGIVITNARFWREESAFSVIGPKQIPRFARDDNSNISSLYCVILVDEKAKKRPRIHMDDTDEMMRVEEDESHPLRPNAGRKGWGTH
jgi:hypothetical protein